MLSGMRSFAKSKFALALFVLIAAALVLTLGNDPFRGVAGGGFISAGQHSYGARDVNRILANYLERVNAEREEPVSREELIAQGAPQQIVSELRQGALVLAFADAIGVRASPKAVTADLGEAFKDSLGRTDVARLQQRAQTLGYRDVREFEAAYRDNLTENYINAAVSSGLHVPDILVQPFVAFQTERRNVAIARPTETTVAAPPEPTPEQLQAFYEEKQSVFERPERRSISVLSYSPADFIDKADIKDADVRAEYDRRIREFSTAETRTVLQFVASSRKPIQDLVDLIKQGRSPEDAAAAVEGVQISTVTGQPDDIQQKDLRQVMFSLPAGETFGPLEVDGAWYGVTVKSVVPGVATPFEEVADQVREELAQFVAQRLYRESENDFYDLAGGLPLEEIGQQIGVPVIRTAPIDASGRALGGRRTALLPQDRDALQVLFTGKAGDLTDVVEGDGFRAMYRVDEIVEASTPPFEEVRADVETLYKVEWSRKEAERIANEVVEKVRAGEALSKVARDARMAVLTPPEPVTRVMSQNMDPAIASALFGEPAGTLKVTSDSRGVPTIIQVIEVLPGDPAIAAQMRPQLVQQLQQSLAQSSAEAFMKGVARRIKVRTNDTAISRYIAGLTAPPQ